MAESFEALRQRITAAAGDKPATTATRTDSSRQPRPIYSIQQELRGIWAGASVIWPKLDSTPHSPPVLTFGDECTTQFLIETRMVYRTLWREAQAALTFLANHRPGANASPRAKAQWVISVYQWIDVALVASNLNLDFWFIPREATSPRCDASGCSDALLATLGCCAARIPVHAYAAAHGGNTEGYDVAAIGGYSTAPDPLDLMRQVKSELSRQTCENFPERGCNVAGWLAPIGYGAAQRSDALWLKYQFNPVWAGIPDPIFGQDHAVSHGNIPDAVLAQIDADAPRNIDKARRAELVIRSMPLEEQLATIFTALAGYENYVAPAIGAWTLATPNGLLEQAQRQARFWAQMSLDEALGRAVLFYTVNHLKYFAERGELHATPSELQAAYEAMQAQGAQAMGAMLATGAAVLGMVNPIAGVVGGIIVGVYNVLAAALGPDAFAQMFTFGASGIHEVRIPQPLMMRTMPRCEQILREEAMSRDAPLADLPMLPSGYKGTPTGMSTGTKIGLAVIGTAGALLLLKALTR